MKVKELIERLKLVPKHLEVMTEGCDCTGDIAEVFITDRDVMLCRSNSCYQEQIDKLKEDELEKKRLAKLKLPKRKR